MALGRVLVSNRGASDEGLDRFLGVKIWKMMIQPVEDVVVPEKERGANCKSFLSLQVRWDTQYRRRERLREVVAGIAGIEG